MSGWDDAELRAEGRHIYLVRAVWLGPNDTQKE